MHVGSFAGGFDVSIDRDGLEQLMHDHEITNGVVFYPDNSYVAEVVDATPGLYALVWGNPRLPGYVEEAARWLEHPKFIGLKLHPLLDGYLPNDASVRLHGRFGFRPVGVFDEYAHQSGRPISSQWMQRPVAG